MNQFEQRCATLGLGHEEHAERLALRRGLLRRTDADAWRWRSADARWIWTGFEPFLDNAFNPSELAAFAAAEAQRAAGLDAEAHRLPVTFAEAAQAPARFLARTPDRPVVLIHMGLAARRAEVSLERRAVERVGAHQDNAGCRPESICPEAPHHMHTTLELARLRALVQSGREASDARGVIALPVQISEDAGAYVCNAIYRHALVAVEARRDAGGLAEALFIHIPALQPAEASALGAVLGRALTQLADEVFAP